MKKLTTKVTKLKPRNVAQLQHIKERPKAGPHKDFKKQASREACRNEGLEDMGEEE